MRLAVLREDVRRAVRFAALRGVAVRVAVLRAFLRRGAPAACAPLIERIIEATAACAAAVAAAVAARTATFSIRAAVLLASPAILRWVLCTKPRLRLAMMVSE